MVGWVELSPLPLCERSKNNLDIIGSEHTFEIASIQSSGDMGNARSSFATSSGRSKIAPTPCSHDRV